MSALAGERLLSTPGHIVVRGHFSTTEMRRLTGWPRGYVRHMLWRYTYIPLRQRQLFAAPRGRYVPASHPGPGAFPVTIIDIVKQTK